MITFKKILALLLSLAMISGFALSPAAVFAEAGEKEDETQSFEIIDPATLDIKRLGEIEEDEEDAPEPAMDLSEIVRVSIVLDDEPAADHGYSLDGIGDDSDADALRNSLRQQQDRLTAEIEKVLRKELNVKWNLTLLANVISAEIRYGDIVKIKRLEGVKDVIIENCYGPQTAETSSASTSENMVGATTVWASGYTGAGRIIAIIDTGIDTTHKSFASDAFDYAINSLSPKPTILDSSRVNTLKSKLNGSSGKYFNSKIPFGFNYIDGNTTIDHMSDFQGNHGSHVAGIAAGNRYVKNGSSYVDAASTVGAIGMAPDAQLLVMKVFGAGGGAYDSDFIAAIEDAIVLGADAVNLSFGSTNQGYSYSDFYQEILDSLSDGSANSKTVVSIAAGNAYGLTQFLKTDLYIDDVSMHTGGSPGTYVNSFCVASADSIDYSGVSSREDAKMSEFSSWGVPGSLLMKPEITAPGGYIYSVYGTFNYLGNTVGGPEQYEYMSGTSMATPHITGLSALLSGYVNNYNLVRLNPDLNSHYSPRAVIQSLLMSTATPMKENGNYVSLLQQGAGLADVSRALGAASVVMIGADDDTLTAITGAASDGKVKVEFGDDPNRTGLYEYSFTIYNLTDDDLHFEFDTDLFTQGCYESDGKYFMSGSTSPLEASVHYSWDQSGFGGKARDVNRDGVTDSKDAQRILEYSIHELGMQGMDITVANMDNDGHITSYDAYLLLKYIEDYSSLPDGLVPAKGQRTVSVTIDLAGTDALESLYPSGFYVEGFTYVICPDIDENNGHAHEHSIPLLGFYGNWTDPSMFDNMTYTGRLYGDIKTSYTGNDYTNFLSVMNGNTTSVFSGNPFMVEDEFPAERLALRSDSKLVSIKYNRLRSASAAGFALSRVDRPCGDVTEVLDSSIVTDPADGIWFDPEHRAWVNTVRRTYKIDSCVSDLGLSEGDSFRVGFYAIPEYNAMKYNYEATGSVSGLLDYDSFEAIIESNSLGHGAYIGYDFTIDDTAPQILSAQLVGNNIVIEASDNENLAYLAVLRHSNSVVIGETAPGKPAASAEFDVTSVINTTSGTGYVVCLAGDYAGNLAACAVKVRDLSSQPDPYAVRSVEITPSNLRLHVGEEADLTAKVLPENAGDKSIVWSSSDESIAVVDQNGHVTIVGSGTARIYAKSSNGKSDSCYVQAIQFMSAPNALVRDANGASYFASITLNGGLAWTKLHSGGKNVPLYSAFMYSQSSNYSSASELYALSFDPETLTSETYSVNRSTYALTDLGPNYMCATSAAIGNRYVFGYADLAYAIESYLVFGNLSNDIYQGLYSGTGVPLGAFDLSPYLDGAWIAAIAYKGGDNASSASYYYILDENGILWSLTVYFDSQTVQLRSGELTFVMDTEMPMSFLNQSIYYAGSNLYWAYNDGEKTTMYVVVPTSREIFNTGSFGDDVVSVTGLYVDGVQAPYYNSQTSPEDDGSGSSVFELLPVEIEKEDILTEETVSRLRSEALKFSKEEKEDAPAHGSLYSLGSETIFLRPHDDAELIVPSLESGDEGLVTISISENVPVTNGYIFLSWQHADNIEYVSMDSDLQYKAIEIYNQQLRISYASLEELPAGTVLFSITFRRNCGDGDYEFYHSTLQRNQDVDLNEFRQLMVPAADHTPEEAVRENENAPGCEVAGSYDEVVYCSICNSEVSRKHITVPALGHDWQQPQYSWSLDHSSCTATKACARDHSHDISETAQAEMTVIREATETERGLVRYVAEFESSEFETQSSDVETPFIGENIDVIPYPSSAFGFGSEYIVNGNVVTVRFAIPCKVGYYDETQGRYVAIPAVVVEGEDNTYSFTAPEGVDEVVLVVKGDTTGDGSVNLGDATRIKAYYRHKTTLDQVALFAADVTGDGNVNLGDTTNITAVFRKKTTISWF
ncbi:MAG: S8 family serine peptidase [Firmicutes bacterium]|nr:S8 family serine peptidase [Bacillota bacterium]